MTGPPRAICITATGIHPFPVTDCRPAKHAVPLSVHACEYLRGGRLRRPISLSTGKTRRTALRARGRNWNPLPPRHPFDRIASQKNTGFWCACLSAYWHCVFVRPPGSPRAAHHSASKTISHCLTRAAGSFHRGGRPDFCLQPDAAAGDAVWPMQGTEPCQMQTSWGPESWKKSKGRM